VKKLEETIEETCIASVAVGSGNCFVLVDSMEINSSIACFHFKPDSYFLKALQSYAL